MLAYCFLCCYCFLIGFLIGKLVTLKKDLDTSSTSTALDPTKTYWKIVRYRKGTKEFDCIWQKNIYDKRVAEQMCAELNDPSHGNEYRYGDYYVESM